MLGLDFDDDGRGVLPVDVDGDGDLDLALLSLQGLRLVRNTSPARKFVRLRLEATRSHALALGAVAAVTAGGMTQRDYVHVTDGFLTQVGAELHFGLGSAGEVERVEVTWPSGGKQAWEKLPADRLLVLKEGKAEAEVVPVPAWPAETQPRFQPAFSPLTEATTVEGERRPVASAGRVAVLNFWAPACAGCRREIPVLAELAKRYGAEADFAGLSLETRDVESVKSAIRELGAAYPQFLAEEEVVRGFFGEAKETPIPATFVFDAGGKLRRAFLREVESEELEAVLVSLRDEGVFGADLAVQGREILQRMKYEEALVVLREAARLRPQDGLLRHEIGLALLGLKKDAEAEVAFAEAVQLEPEYGQALSNLGTARMKLGRPAEAIDPFRRAIRLRPSDVGLRLSFAGAAAQSGQVALALDACSKAAELAPDSAEPLVVKAKVLLIARKTEEARKCLEEALRKQPGHPEAQELLRRLPRMGGGLASFRSFV